jgi:hypothetical protein
MASTSAAATTSPRARPAERPSCSTIASVAASEANDAPTRMPAIAAASTASMRTMRRMRVLVVTSAGADRSASIQLS